MIDVHAHLNDERLIDNIPEILENAKNVGVNKIICVGSSLSSSQRALQIAEKYENVFCAIGVHPDDAEKFDEDTLNWLKENSTHPKVVAIGEIGLDFHYKPFNKEKQLEVFEKQLLLASEIGLPVQIHTRDATGLTLETLQKNRHLLKNGGIIHCYSGSTETLKEILKLGLSISLGGIVTFKNARETLEVAEVVPLDRLVLETDCPYLAPHPHRGETNQPRFVTLVAEKIAIIKGISYDEVATATTANAHKIFPKLSEFSV